MTVSSRQCLGTDEYMAATMNYIYELYSDGEGYTNKVDIVSYLRIVWHIISCQGMCLNNVIVINPDVM